MKLVLASRSPRRQELLQNAGFSFSLRISDVEEKPNYKLPFGEMVIDLARQKSRELERQADEVILAADTIVVLDDTVLGKPKDRADGAKMLRALSGREHLVFTGVYIESQGGSKAFFSRTSVKFFELESIEIEEYLDTGEPFDKAGAYGIQGRGAVLVEEICGDYFNVMGLPIAKTARALKELGVLPKNI